MIFMNIPNYNRKKKKQRTEIKYVLRRSFSLKNFSLPAVNCKLIFLYFVV